jgi:large subunit ribosomal protein L17
MNHGNKINHLGRKYGHRKALLMNMSNALIKHKRINTTLAKAKALRTHLEPLITKSKKDTMHSRRVVFSYLQDKNTVSELFATIGPKVMDRPGGYLRIIKTGFRQGDAAETAMIEFVDFNNTYTPGTGGEKKKRTRRSRRRSGGGQQSKAAVSTNEEE